MSTSTVGSGATIPGPGQHHEHAVPESTHTLELRQVAEINAAIAAGRVRLTPADLELDDAPVEAAGAPLHRLVMEGSPAFPYLFARFGVADDDTPVAMHTEHLRRLSRALHLHHHWGL